MALLDWVSGHRDQMLDDLRTYVELESPSDDKESLNATLAWLGSWLDERLGEPGRLDRIDGGARGDVEVRDYPGRGDKPILLLCHYDTVWPLGTLAEIPFRIDGDRATGPGIFDMKSGLVQAVWALKALSDAGLDRPPIRLVLTGDEETGSIASRHVIEAEAAGTSAALVFEASADGAVKTARKGVGIFRVDATGIEAHAGLDPEKGCSAIDEIARVVLDLHGLTDLAKGTTVNVGILEGGTRTNVAAGRASAEVDVRVASQEEADRVDRALAELRPHDARATLTVSGEWNRPVMERTDTTVTLYERARVLAAELGVDLRECAVGGASDGNFVAPLGIPVLDGFGAVGDGAHARHEHISVRGMLERTALAAAVLHALN
ncbi:M20 family metallopeptidase [Amycolatopsis pithecellobii]|uniref:M20/M25/M40 family metallo-hydrolase n=1 Tax=Amycolatopsis pithecellobii TaxID=664692 RepID=A0A6N7Z8D4_9PSEU|nr:M20 family metallopeptidase [Amycolatopsis pithecellobii]MTD56696.1 M20/M25/M40 family metallo-hydrolase [Amycolatopsis pithecellobii]